MSKRYPALLALLVVPCLNLDSRGQEEVAPAADLRRPQEPIPPFPYRTLEVQYDNSEAEAVTLAATLTLPEGTGPFPAVLFISGSGQSSRDSSFMGHKMFLVLADALTRRGVATLRYDDRGAGDSTAGTKGPEELTADDHVSDARAGLEFLKRYPEIDPRRIGVLGHSEGTHTGQILAVKRPADVAFLVLLSGGSRSKGDIVEEQSATIAAQRGFSEAAQAADRRFVQRSRVVTKEEVDLVKRRSTINAIADEELATVPEPERTEIDPLFRMRVHILSSAEFHRDAQAAPTDYLRRIQCPVLALNGGKDVLIKAETHVPGIQEAVQAAGHSDSMVKLLPELNHMFQTARTGSMEEAGEIDETFAPAALELIGEWISARVHTQPQPLPE